MNRFGGGKSKSGLCYSILFFILVSFVNSLSNEKVQVSDVSQEASRNEVQSALSVLNSAGINTEYLCHHGDEQLDSILPRCLDQSSYRRFLSEEEGEDESEVPRTKWYYMKNSIMVLVCVTCAALAAGLTMGLLSLEVLDLKIKLMAASSEADKESAQKILPLMRDYHRLLVTLLLLNSFSNEALPIFLDALVPSYMAVIISVTLVLFFGEIIPTAIFAGPNKLKVASNCAFFVKFLLFIFAPLAIPIARMLDHFLHDHENEDSTTKYNRGELAALVKIQYEERMAYKADRRRKRLEEVATSKSLSSVSQRKSNPGRRSVHFDEVTMITGALQMRVQTAQEVMTPISDAYALCVETILNEENMVDIYRSGFSRVPVFSKAEDSLQGTLEEKTSIIGVLHTRNLIVVDTTHSRSLSQLPLQKPHCISPGTTMIELVNLFQKGGNKGDGGGHMGIVCLNPAIGNLCLSENSPISAKAGVIGIVTLEDCLEELIQEEIYDEFDKAEVRRLDIARKTFRKWRSFAKKKRFQNQDATSTNSVATEDTPLMSNNHENGEIV